MRGRRVPDETEPHLYEPGDYGRWDGEWYCRTPADLPADEDGYGPRLSGRLSNHEVIEHDDGTITVSPSILCWTDWGEERTHYEWHGYLRGGVWESC